MSIPGELVIHDQVCLVSLRKKTDEDSFIWCQNAVTRQLRHLSSRRATSACKIKLIQSQILPTILYRAVHPRQAGHSLNILVWKKSSLQLTGSFFPSM
jgi:hypothetical protein